MGLLRKPFVPTHGIPEYNIVICRVEVPCGPDEWGEWFAKRLGLIWKTRVGKYTISTVALGMDHGFGESSLYYETMIFTKDDHERDMRRYARWKHAKSAHRWIVKDFQLRQKKGRLDGKIMMPWDEGAYGGPYRLGSYQFEGN